MFLFNLTIPSCPDRKLNANEMNDNNTKNDNTTALPSIYFDNDVDSDSDWLSDSSYDSVTDINIKIERKKCKRRVLSIVCGMIWLAILSYAAVEFVTHLCNIFVQEYGNQILPILGDGTNNIGKGSFESFIGSVVLSFLVSQSMDVHNSYFLDAPKAKETATTPGNDVIFRVALFDTLFNIGMPFCLVLPFYKKGNYNMEVPQTNDEHGILCRSRRGDNLLSCRKSFYGDVNKEAQRIFLCDRTNGSLDVHPHIHRCGWCDICNYVHKCTGLVVYLYFKIFSTNLSSPIRLFHQITLSSRVLRTRRGLYRSNHWWASPSLR